MKFFKKIIFKEKLMKNTIKNEKKLLKKQQKEEKRNEKWLKKYGVTYTEVNDERPIQKLKNEIKKDKQKNEQNKISYKKFVHYFSKHKGLLSVAVLFSLICVALRFYSIPLFQQAIDFCTIGQWGDAMKYVAFSGLSIMVGFLFGFSMDIFMSKVSVMGVAEIRHDLAVKVLNTKSSAYKTLSTGEIVYRVSSEPNDFVNSLKNMIYSLESSLYAISAVLYILVSNYLLGICFVVIVAFNIFRYMFVRKKRSLMNRRNKILGEKMNTHVNEFVRGSDDVKSLNLKHSLLGVFDKWAIFRRNSAQSQMNYNTYLGAFVNTATTIIIFSSIILGIYLTGIEAISFGLLIVFLNERNAPQNFAGNLVEMLYAVQDSKVSCDRMAKLFNEEIYAQEKFGDKELIDYSGKLEFKNVTFSYGDEKVLENINFIVPPKRSLGIVGKSGEGKSTILGLIERLIDCDGGEILLDGVNNKDLTENALRGNISLVPQTPYIFNASVRENLLYAKSDATEEELIDVLKKAQFYDFVMSKPDKMETLVGEGGVVLSGGQRQRLAIARAFLTNSKVIMLDEATSALDNKNQEGIKDVIKKMQSQCSFIIVAHRLSTIVDCDEIIVIDNHKIIDRGTHEELMKSCEIYSNLYKLEKKSQ